MFWSRKYVEVQKGKEKNNNGVPLRTGRVVVEAKDASDAYANIAEIERTWADDFYCVDSVMGPFNTEEEARR